MWLLCCVVRGAWVVGRASPSRAQHTLKIAACHQTHKKTKPNNSWAQLLEAEGVISKFVPIDFSDADTVLDQCLAGIKGAVEKLGGALDGATTRVVLIVLLLLLLSFFFCAPCFVVMIVAPAARVRARVRGGARLKAGAQRPRLGRLWGWG